MPGHSRLVVADRLDCRRGAAGDDDAQGGDVVAGKSWLVEDGDDRGRRRGHIGDALALDELEGILGGEALEQYRTAAGDDRLEEAQVAPIEAYRQIDELHLPFRHTHVGVDPVHGRQRRVERMQDALGVARRARGERHAEDLVGADRYAIFAREGSGFGDTALETPCLIDYRTGDHDMSKPRNRRSELARHRRIVKSPKDGGTDQGAATREAQNVIELAHPEVRVDLVGDRADQLEGEEGDRKGNAVRQLDGDDVAAVDADAP